MAKRTGAKGQGTDPTSVITVLSVSPAEEDHSVLRDFFHAKPAAQQPKIKWLLHVARTLEAAAAALQTKPVAIVICESNLLPGSWKDLLKHVSAHPQPPLMIVTSRLADEYLWSEALHHGAYDVLSKPFDPDELTRVLTLASLKWRHPHKGR